MPWHHGMRPIVATAALLATTLSLYSQQPVFTSLEQQYRNHRQSIVSKPSAHEALQADSTEPFLDSWVREFPWIDRSRLSALCIPRKSTEYIIVHTTEGGEGGIVDLIEKNRLANFLIHKNGKTREMIGRNCYADHAGQSAWYDRRDLSWHSIGIEIVGMHNGTLTRAQEDSLRDLLREIIQEYDIPDESVLAHYQVAYDEPGGIPTRGRKWDGTNINWRALGIAHNTEDPLITIPISAGGIRPGGVQYAYQAERDGKRMPYVDYVPEKYLSRPVRAARYAGQRVRSQPVSYQQRRQLIKKSTRYK
jgi:hypothetical protein